MERMENQTLKYQKNEIGNMKEEEAGKVESETKSGERTELGNPSGKKEKSEVSGNNAKGGEREGEAIDIYWKLNRLPSGSMIKQHMVQHLRKSDQDKVLLSLVVTKGNRKFTRTKEELAREWKWHSREMLIEMFNDEMAMAEDIFKAMYLED